jgi:excisionase family DNA binding protein
MNSDQPERFVTTAEAADFLRMSKVAFFQAVHRGEFPAYRLGAKRLRFKLSELNALLQPLSVKKETVVVGGAVNPEPCDAGVKK